MPGYTPKGEEVAQTSRDGQNLLTDADKKFFSDLDARQEFARKGGGDLAYAPQAEGISDVTPGSYQDQFNVTPRSYQDQFNLRKVADQKLMGGSYGDESIDQYLDRLNSNTVITSDARVNPDLMKNVNVDTSLSGDNINSDLLLPGTKIPPPPEPQIAGLPPKDMTYGEYFTELGVGSRIL